MFELEIRLPVGLVTDEVMAVIEAVVPRYPDATVELKRQEVASNPSSFSSVDHPIIEHLKENANAVGGVQRGLFPPWVLQIASITGMLAHPLMFIAVAHTAVSKLSPYNFIG
jgi:hypothetical protein